MSEYSKYDIINSDPFWLNNFKILFQSNRLKEFIPNNDMSYNEKLNSIMRFSIYLSIILTFFKENYLFLYIPIFIGVFTYFLQINYYKNLKHYESFDKERDNNFSKKNKTYSKKKIYKCQLPSINNPFMNVLNTDIKYRPERPPACEITPEVNEDIEDKFNINLYRNVSDVYGKTNSQRQYYTMPSTTIPNDQTRFSKWLYGSSPSCKEGNNEQCVANIYDNVLADTPFNYKYIN